MQKLIAILAATLFSAAAPLAFAGKAKEPEPASKAQGVENMSEQGAVNTNSPESGDQLKGQERADERQAMELPSADKPDGKGKKKAN